MILLVLEALAALIVLALIVWWTMFSGRPRGEIVQPDPAEANELPAKEVSSDRPQNT